MAATTEAFLAAIRAQPDDDLPRLIFADWLDERGDPHGAFVRAQIELARASENEPQRKNVAELEAALLRQFEEEWLGELHDELINWRFDRGFIEVSLDVRRFLQQPNAWLDQPTVVGVHLYAPPQMEPELLTALTVAPRAERVRSLNLGFEWLCDAGACTLAAANHLHNLAALDLGTNGISDAGALALAGAPDYPGLRCLSLRNNLIGDVGVTALAMRSGLWHLDLSSNVITKIGAQALADADALESLQALRLAGNRFDGRSRGGKALKRRFGARVSWR